MDIIRNAAHNLQRDGMMWPVAKDQIENAIILLDKDYDLYDDVDLDELAKQHGSLENVPIKM